MGKPDGSGRLKDQKKDLYSSGDAVQLSGAVGFVNWR